MPPFDKLKRTIFFMAAVMLLILLVNILARAIVTNSEKKQTVLLSGEFLSHIENGEYDRAALLWPSVYPSIKSDGPFLDSFENTLIEKYRDYYDSTYLENRRDDSLFEICRVYNSFLDTSHVEALADSVFDDYIAEKIDYERFVKAENDLYFFTQYNSKHIGGLLENGLVVSKSRQSYLNALDLAESGDYIAAVDLLKTVPPMDTTYYPLALEQIDALIIEIRDNVKNAN